MSTRNCPKCGEETIYKSEVTFNRAVLNNAICVGCAARGRVPWNKTSPETEAQIHILHSAGFSTPEICRKIQKAEGTVGGILQRLGLTPNLVNHRLDIVDANQARCTQCKTICPISQFTNGSKCPECTRQVNLVRCNGERLIFIRDRVNTLRSRSKKKGILCTITAEYLLSQLEKQGDKCAYTGLEMRMMYGQGRSPLSLSVDRIDPNLGYTEGNVVLCTLRSNTIKSDLTLEELQQWIPGWYNSLQLLLNKDGILP